MPCVRGSFTYDILAEVDDGAFQRGRQNEDMSFVSQEVVEFVGCGLGDQVWACVVHELCEAVHVAAEKRESERRYAGDVFCV